MNRYHKKVYIPNDHEPIIEAFNQRLNTLKWRYSMHSLDNLKYRAINQKDILLFIKDLKLNYNDIFEYYTDEKNHILKICYRVPYTKNSDIIIVISDLKEIITIYINSADDDHITLNKNLYVRN